MLSVIRIAGPSLRELNLPRSSLSLLKQLPEFCTRLAKIYIQDYPSFWDKEELSEIDNISLLPLRSLSIESPSSRTLRLLSKTPEDLSLISVTVRSDMLLALKALLRNLPRKLQISFCTKKPFNDSIRAYLHEICPGVEEFSLKLFHGCGDEDEDGNTSPLSRLVTLLKKTRGNERSKCRKMTLEGDVLEFLEYAHTEAHIQVTCLGQTFIDSGDGIYPTRITLSDEYLNQNLSRLTDIVIKGDEFSIVWEDLLSGIRLKRVRVEGACTSYLRCMDIKADVIEVSCNFLTDVSGDPMEWYGSPCLIEDRYKDIVRWLHGANEVRISDRYMCDWRVFFASLARFIDEFPGKAVFLGPSFVSSWIDSYYDPSGDYENDDCISGALIMFLRRAVEKFEAGGGDACTVRSLVDAIWRN